MSVEEFYEFEHLLEGLDEEMLVMAFGILGVMLLAGGLILIVGYIFQSVGLYTIANRRGIQNPWLAWLPVGNYWIAGSIADQYQYVVNGAVKNRRMILLVLSVAGIVVSSLTASMATGGFYLMIGRNAEHFAALGAVGTVLNLISAALEIATFVFWQIALYDLYTSCNPKNNVLFLVLGIIFGVTIPYFIFFSRNKELGMPPRREEPRYEEHSEPRDYREPWDNP